MAVGAAFCDAHKAKIKDPYAYAKFKVAAEPIPTPTGRNWIPPEPPPIQWTNEPLTLGNAVEFMEDEDEPFEDEEPE